MRLLVCDCYFCVILSLEGSSGEVGEVSGGAGHEEASSEQPMEEEADDGGEALSEKLYSLVSISRRYGRDLNCEKT